MQIIIADDEAITRRLLRSLLSKAGHEVFEATDGEAAWRLLQATNAAILITDWHMPILDGPRLIARIRANPTHYVYAIILTTSDSKDALVTGLASGADDYLTKPFHHGELLARIAIGARILELERNLREARDRYAFQSRHDPLTGMLNRLAITSHIEAELSRANRSSYPLSLALLDLDHFKAVNDRYGHLVGDQVLCHVAQRLSTLLRPYDWLGRWGGEEFLAVLTNTTTEQALIVAERLRHEIALNPLLLADGTPITLTVSIGIACTGSSQAGEMSANTLFQAADHALYHAKAAGRNRVWGSVRALSVEA